MATTKRRRKLQPKRQRLLLYKIRRKLPPEALVELAVAVAVVVIAINPHRWHPYTPTATTTERDAVKKKAGERPEGDSELETHTRA